MNFLCNTEIIYAIYAIFNGFFFLVMITIKVCYGSYESIHLHFIFPMHICDGNTIKKMLLCFYIRLASPVTYFFFEHSKYAQNANGKQRGIMQNSLKYFAIIWLICLIGKWMFSILLIRITFFFFLVLCYCSILCTCNLIVYVQRAQRRLSTLSHNIFKWFLKLNPTTNWLQIESI